MSLLYVKTIFVTHSIPKGCYTSQQRGRTASTSPEKSPKGKLGQSQWFTSEWVKGHWKLVFAKNESRFRFQDLKKAENANLTTIGGRGVNQDQWPRLLEVKNYVRGYVCLSFDLKHASCLHSSQSQQAKLLEILLFFCGIRALSALKTWFRWKSVGDCTYFLWRHGYYDLTWHSHFSSGGAGAKSWVRHRERDEKYIHVKGTIVRFF